MVKNIIFDMDNTIIRNEKEDSIYYKEALKELGYDEEEYLNVYNGIEKYETIFDEKENYYSRSGMIEFINQKLNTNYPIQLIDKINQAVGKYWIKRIMLKEETIRYLSSKYHCYVFSNWFTCAQTERIKRIGYSKYFKGVLCSDQYGSKPYQNAYQNVLEAINAKPEECIMIGDTKKTDVWGANRIGMKAILFDYNGKRDDETIKANDYIVIRDLKELEKIL